MATMFVIVPSGSPDQSLAPASGATQNEKDVVVHS